MIWYHTISYVIIVPTTETPFKTLKEKADQIAQSIIDAIADSVKRRSATNGKLRKTKN
jgi:uncharacterized protein with ATP-grasp and redox domains